MEWTELGDGISVMNAPHGRGGIYLAGDEVEIRLTENAMVKLAGWLVTNNPNVSPLQAEVDALRLGLADLIEANHLQWPTRADWRAGKV